MSRPKLNSAKDPIVCPDCGWVEVEHDVFETDALGERIGVSGECPKCGDRLYYAPADDDADNSRGPT